MKLEKERRVAQMKITPKMAMIEKVKGGWPIKEILNEYYDQQKCSYQQLAHKLSVQTDISVSASQVWRWRIHKLEGRSRTNQEAVSLVRRDAGGKTIKMRSFELSMGGMEIDKIIPFLFSIGYEYKDVISFLKGYNPYESLKKSTVYTWMKEWGYQPRRIGKESGRKKERQAVSYKRLREFLKENPDVLSCAQKRYHREHPEVIKALSQRWQDVYQNPEKRLEQSRIVNAYFQQHPEVGRKKSQKMKAYYLNPRNREAQSERLRKYYTKHPEAREYLSLLMKQRWQSVKSKITCIVLEETIDPDDCEIVKQSYADECREKGCPLYNRSEGR